MTVVTEAICYTIEDFCYESDQTFSNIPETIHVKNKMPETMFQRRNEEKDVIFLNLT